MSIDEIRAKLEKSLSDLIPDSFRSNNEYFDKIVQLFSEVIADEIIKSNSLNDIFNFKESRDEVIPHISNRYDISFPEGYTTEMQRFLLRYFPHFIKVKGTNRVLDCLDFIGITEKEFYGADQETLAMMPYSPNFKSEGIYDVNLNNNKYNYNQILANFGFSQSLLNRLIPAGMSYTLVNDQNGGE